MALGVPIGGGKNALRRFQDLRADPPVRRSGDGNLVTFSISRPKKVSKRHNPLDRGREGATRNPAYGFIAAKNRSARHCAFIVDCNGD
jgi:hypothetical protein